MTELTDKQQVFIEEYLVCLNATVAARRAGYSADSARQIGSENLSKPYIREEIDRRLAERAMPAGEVLGRLTAIARASMEDLLSVRGRTMALDLKAAQERGVLHLVKKYTKTDRGTTVELYDAQGALELLGKYHKLWTEKIEHGGSIDLKGYTQVSPDDWSGNPPTE